MNVRSYARGLIGQPRGGCDFVGTEALVRDWTFRASRPDLLTMLARRSMRRRLVPPPPSRVITPVDMRRRWSLYFIYAPDGRMRPSHRFTLRRLRSNNTALAVVYASPSAADVPSELVAATDALYWKGLSGFDFSAYAIGLHALAEHSRGADIFVMNDSVYGPFSSLDTVWAQIGWDMTGFTASGNIQNHIQSYAFLLRDWNVRKFNGLKSILRLEDAYAEHRDVVFGQESLFAQQATKTMSVGSQWYADYEKCSDVTIYAALALCEAGFPFMKKSLFTKYAHLVDQGAFRAALQATGHPLPD